MRRIILLATPLLLIVLLAFRFSGPHTVSGTLKDEQGNAIPGGTVTEKGSRTTATSDTHGAYRITISDAAQTLVFSAVGYETKEVKVKGRKVVDVVLAASTQSLQEVVVVGHATKRKADITGSASVMIRGAAAGVRTQGYYQNSAPFNTEDYDNISENGFHKAADEPLSTFSIDVDAASYSNVRRYLNNNTLPPAGAVRVEELINYFTYDYPAPKDRHPFSINTEMSACPWNKDHQLVLIGLQGKKIPGDNLPPSNLVFLIDVSGSMNHPLKLPLVKSSLKLLVDQLREEDKISIVVYAGAAGLVLPPTAGSNKTAIKDALERLEAGGSTAGGEGIKLAYKTAREQLLPKGNNRVILCTDGDFNIGVSSDDDLVRLVEKERESGVYLTVLGYGMGNYKDNKMQKLADKGNGNHAYIDGLSEAKKVLVSEFGGTLFTIAKDVKLQVEFNPARVQGYRLVGYENRLLNKEDFNDDKKDAGELGSGHTVTALYEVIPVGVRSPFLKDVDPLKYQSSKNTAKASPELMTVKFRYKAPEGGSSQLIEHPVMDKHIVFEKTGDNFRFAASVAQFGMLLRDSEFKGTSSFSRVARVAGGAKGKDTEGYRKEFIKLVKKAALIKGLDEEEDVVVQ
ncbi:MAG TPA: von Willebrand factor type A domain-containing protein [Chitinophagaceae bacterium]